MNVKEIIDRFQLITNIDRSKIIAIKDDMEQFFIPHEMQKSPL